MDFGANFPVDCVGFEWRTIVQQTGYLTAGRCCAVETQITWIKREHRAAWSAYRCKASVTGASARSLTRQPDGVARILLESDTMQSLFRDVDSAGELTLM